MSASYLHSELPEILNHTFYSGALGRDSVVVDLGGHAGEFSRVVSREKGCLCYVVEASAENVARIRETDRIRKFHYAIAGANGPVTLHIARDATHWGSIAPFPDTPFGPALSVEGITLETLIERLEIARIDLLKVDIEGAEIAMFDATSDETLRSIAVITVEFHDFVDPGLRAPVQRIKARLRGLGFECIVFTRHFHGDVLFLNQRCLRLPAWKLLRFRCLKYLRGLRRIAAKARSPVAMGGG